MNMGKSISELGEEAYRLWAEEGVEQAKAVRQVTNGYSPKVRQAVRRRVLELYLAKKKADRES